MSLNAKACAAVAGSAIGALLITGCQSSGEPAAERTGPTAEGSSPVAEEPAESTELSPLDEFLGEDAVSFDDGLSFQLDGSRHPWERSQAQLEWIHAVQGYTAECMRDAGFEYVEFVPNAADWPDELRDAYSLPDDEFAAQYGYGISTIDVPRSTGDNRNDRLRAEMSPTERDAYDAALYGDRAAEPRYESSGGRDVVGCMTQAEAEADKEIDPSYEQEKVDLLVEELSVLQGRIQSEPRVVAAEKDWAACMRDAGVPEMSAIGDGRVAVVNRWNDATGNVEGQEPQDPAPEVHKEIQDHEIHVATSDHRCREEFYDETFNAVVNELEAEFVEQHKDLLETFREALAAGE